MTARLNKTERCSTFSSVTGKTAFQNFQLYAASLSITFVSFSLSICWTGFHSVPANCILCKSVALSNTDFCRNKWRPNNIASVRILYTSLSLFFSNPTTLNMTNIFSWDYSLWLPFKRKEDNFQGSYSKYLGFYHPEIWIAITSYTEHFSLPMKIVCFSLSTYFNSDEKTYIILVDLIYYFSFWLQKFLEGFHPYLYDITGGVGGWGWGAGKKRELELQNRLKLWGLHGDGWQKNHYEGRKTS